MATLIPTLGACVARMTSGERRVAERRAQQFGRGFDAKNLRRIVQFAQMFPQAEIAATLSRQLSWTHFVDLLPLKTEPARQFYASQAATHTWSVRELRHQIERKAFDRTELAALQTHTPVHAEPVCCGPHLPRPSFQRPVLSRLFGPVPMPRRGRFGSCHIGSATRSSAHACAGGGREGSCADVLRSGYESYTEDVDRSGR